MIISLLLQDQGKAALKVQLQPQGFKLNGPASRSAGG
jgi:hypothetical protein